MSQILAFKKSQRQAFVEKVMTDSIFPIKYIDSIDCDSHEYDETEFNIDSHTGEIFPPCTNRGGIKETSVLSTSYELTPPPAFSCIVDYLSITFSLARYSEGDNISKIETFVGALSLIVSQLRWSGSNKGLFGYKQSCYLTRNNLQVGLIGFDGNNDSCYLSLSGQGCVGVDMVELRAFVESLPVSKITRIDLAYDDLQGELSVRDYKKLYEMGQFSIKGASPSARFVDDMGSNKGCTLYIGKKTNGKEACIYEKGKQLGDESSSWLRVEGRITAVDRVVPFEAMTQPAQFLAALYPPFNKFSSLHQHIEIIKKHATIAFDNLLEYASIAYGKLIDYMMFNGYSEVQIVAKMRRAGVPARLQIPDSGFKNMVPF